MSLFPPVIHLDSTAATPLPSYPAPLDTVIVDGMRVVYYDSGGDGEAVLFVHGLGTNLSIWRENLSAFTGTHRVLALDLPGYGLSDKAGVPATMPFFARTIAHFLDALDVDRVHYIGLSMGGQIGLTFALAYPDRLNRLVLASPAGIETFTPTEATFLKNLFTPEALQSVSEETYVRNVALNFSHYDAEKFGWLIEQRRAMSARPDFVAYTVANARSVAGMLDGPVFDRLAEIRAPTLVIYGEDDHLIPNVHIHPDLTIAAIAQRAAEAIPGCDVMMLEDAGHILPLEQPAAFNAAALAFLRSP